MAKRRKKRYFSIKDHRCRSCGQKFDPKQYRSGGGWYCSWFCRTKKQNGNVVHTNKKSSSVKEKKIDYKVYLQSGTWKRKRLLKLEQVGNSCENCGFRADKGLHVHHLTYERLGDELLEDLKVLCEDCHNDIHQKTKRVTENIWGGKRFKVFKKRGIYHVFDKHRKVVLSSLTNREAAILFAKGADKVPAPVSGQKVRSINIPPAPSRKKRIVKNNSRKVVNFSNFAFNEKSLLLAGEKQLKDRKIQQKKTDLGFANKRSARAKIPNSSWRTPDISSPFRFINK